MATGSPERWTRRIAVRRGLRIAPGKHFGTAVDDAGRPRPYDRDVTRRPDVRDRLAAISSRLRGATRRATDSVRASGRRRATRRLPTEGVVHIEYSPDLDGDADPGEVVWAWVPFQEDPSQGKDRPVAVIGRRGTKLVGVPLTTKRDDREAQVPMGTGRWDSQRRESYARIWRLLDLEPGDVRREGAVLAPERFEQLVLAVDHYYDVSVSPATEGTARVGRQ